MNAADLFAFVFNLEFMSFDVIFIFIKKQISAQMTEKNEKICKINSSAHVHENSE